MINRKYIVLILFNFIFLKINAQELPRYIFINSAPGRNWTVKKPCTINRRVFDEVLNTINAPYNNKLKVGISFIFDFLSTDIDSVKESLDKFLKLSQETKVPVLIHLDGANWWNARPDLWNWWDPSQPGYNPENKKNVEWTSWDESSAIKISWRNWGKQFRVLPAPNLASPAVVNAHIDGLNQLIPIITEWYNALQVSERYLLGGVKLGHEASIGVNAYYYKNGNRYLEQMPNNTNLDPLDSYNTEAGFNGGLAQLGYAAVKTSGIKNKGRITKADMEQVVHKYLDTLSSVALNLGLPKSIIFTHQGGTYSPWEKHLSFSSGSNNYSLPGYSLYSTNPSTAGDLTDILDRRIEPGWAAVEWWWPGNNKNEWIYNIQQTLQFKDCRFVAIFNWENSLDKYPDGIEAIKEVVAEWK
ncbi:MAG: hypothetical protein H7098_07110 [Oligoflexus sp.]|nr:hypothetical protein [Pseudopedobacter sp.]